MIHERVEIAARAKALRFRAATLAVGARRAGDDAEAARVVGLALVEVAVAARRDAFAEVNGMIFHRIKSWPKPETDEDHERQSAGVGTLSALASSLRLRRDLDSKVPISQRRSSLRLGTKTR